MTTIQAWQPKRRTRACEVRSCELREDVRTDAIRYNGRPLSLCAEHWQHYSQTMPEDLRPREPLPTL